LKKNPKWRTAVGRLEFPSNCILGRAIHIPRGVSQQAAKLERIPSIRGEYVSLFSDIQDGRRAPFWKYDDVT